MPIWHWWADDQPPIMRALTSEKAAFRIVMRSSGGQQDPKDHLPARALAGFGGLWLPSAAPLVVCCVR